MRRTQIYLDEKQHSQLKRRAAAAGTTISDLIRRAVDAQLAEPVDDEEWRRHWKEVVDATAGIAPYLPDSETYLDEIRAEERRRRAAGER